MGAGSPSEPPYSSVRSPATIEVFLHVLPVFGPLLGVSRAALRDLCADVVVERLEEFEDALFQMIRKIRDPRYRLAATIAYPRPTLCRFTAQRVASDLAGRYPVVEAVHVFRLYLAPFAEPFLDRAGPHQPVCRLDLDDDESETHRRFATLAEHTGRDADKAFERAEAAKYEVFEGAFLSRFDAVFLSGGADPDRLARRHPDACFIEVPNAVRLPSPVHPPVVAHEPANILFVGTMNYPPNEDAARFFCNEVLPLIRERRTKPIQVEIAGRSPTKAVRASACYPT